MALSASDRLFLCDIVYVPGHPARFQVGKRVATATEWARDHLSELAGHLFKVGFALESDVVDVLDDMVLLTGTEA